MRGVLRNSIMDDGSFIKENCNQVEITPNDIKSYLKLSFSIDVI